MRPLGPAPGVPPRERRSVWSERDTPLPGPIHSAARTLARPVPILVVTSVLPDAARLILGRGYLPIGGRCWPAGGAFASPGVDGTTGFQEGVVLLIRPEGTPV